MAEDKTGRMTRRAFIKTSAAASIATMSVGAAQAFAGGSDTIRVGIVGCGGRGRYDGTNCVNSSAGVEIVALADIFEDRVQDARRHFEEKAGPKFKVTDDTCFIGLDGYKKVLASDIDLVIFTTPPYFRPEHLRAAVSAGKHVFIEKPVAVDPVGVRSIIESSKMADRKSLTILTGTQMRRAAHLQAVMERLHNGDMGDILAGQCCRIGGAMLGWGTQQRNPEWSDMQWQIRRWLFYNWLAGDFITEQHVHNIDLVNWALGCTPVKCMAMGGREVRRGEKFGNIFDHFAAEYEYPNGVRVQYMGSQIEGSSVRCDQRLVGTRGSCYFDFGQAYIKGEKPFKYEGTVPNPCLRQHADQIAAIREGEQLNEGIRIAESSLTAIMGRISAYTGRELSWKWVMKASQLKLGPEELSLSGATPEKPAAVPGKTQLV